VYPPISPAARNPTEAVEAMRAICGLAAGAAVLMHGCANNQEFDSFVSKYNKVYASEEERSERERIFNTNIELINKENAKQSSFKAGVTEYADMSSEEFGEKFLGFVDVRLFDANAPNHTLTRAGNLPPSVDWNKGHNGIKAVTSVKNQNPCGTCWSFAQTAAIEGIRAIRENGKLVSLSNQEMMDCLQPAHPCTGAGAGGGLTEGVVFAKNNGLYSYSDYTFLARTGSCHAAGSKELAPGKITGYVNVPSNDENALMDALSQQPVAVAVNAQYGGPIQHYTGGVVHTDCSSQLDHAVLAVGYGHDSQTGLDYWMIKNSWGANWGEDGFFRLERGRKLCGILAWSAYPTMD